MASITMTAAFPGLTKRSPAGTRTSRVMAAAAAGEKANVSVETEKKDGRRKMVFAAATAAIAACSVASGMVAFAGEPKRGTEEARKIYAPICVTMPTARICHK